MLSIDRAYISFAVGAWLVRAYVVVTAKFERYWRLPAVDLKTIRRVKRF
jgi:hypothetical protein